jgi:hypothetical protein
MPILEKLSDEEMRRFNNIGYYLGSFDPLHSGHIELTKMILRERLCDAVLMYCVNGESSYKQRSCFEGRTRAIADVFNGQNSVLFSFLRPRELRQKLSENCVASITGIMGSDIALALEQVNPDPQLERIRQERQLDFMSGQIVTDDVGSLSCSTALEAIDFIVGLRGNAAPEDIHETICGRNVRATLDMRHLRFISSTKIRESAVP